MRGIICEIRKSLYFPLFALSCVGIVLICCFSEGYVSAGGRSYSIAELLLFLRRDVMLSDFFLNRYEIWTRGIGTWSQIIFPFLLSVGYLYTISSEKLSGLNRLLLVRESNIRYCISKLASALFGGGVILLAGYLLFGLLVYARFPSIYEYPLDQRTLYEEMRPGFHEAVFALRYCAGVFLYGMSVNVFAYFAAVFFRDKYILCCLPLMLKYIWGQVVMKIEIGAINQENDAILNLCSCFRMESILNIGMPGADGTALLFAAVLYLAGLCLSMYLLRSRGEGYGFE